MSDLDFDSSFEREELDTEEDPEGQVSLFQVKESRKRAQEDFQLLANRIALLKQEEAKAMKKIEETRKKAKEVLEVRQRNNAVRRQKEEERRQKQEELRIRMQNQRMLKEQNRQTKEQNLNQVKNKNKIDAQTVKQTSYENKQQIESIKNEQMYINFKKSRQIRKQHEQAKMSKQRVEEEKREKRRMEQEKLMEMEMKVKEEKEREIERLEREEMELISRLQNTQRMQQSAFEDLEMAISGNLEVDDMFQLQHSQDNMAELFTVSIKMSLQVFTKISKKRPIRQSIIPAKLFIFPKHILPINPTIRNRRISRILHIKPLFPNKLPIDALKKRMSLNLLGPRSPQSCPSPFHQPLYKLHSSL